MLRPNSRQYTSTDLESECYLTIRRGVMSTARHSVNITCRGVTSTARHGARSHSFVYISKTQAANVTGLLRACS